MFPSSTTPRLHLEQLTHENYLHYVPAFHAFFSSPKSMDWSSVAPVESIEKSREIIETFLLPKPEQPDLIKYMFLLRPPPATESSSLSETGKSEEKGEMVGWTQTNRWGVHGLEMGYFMLEKYTGKGYVTEGVRGFLDLFWTLPEMNHVKALTAGVDLDNAASKRVLQKLGAREGEIVKGGMKRFVRAPVESDCMWSYFDRPTSIDKES